ncbi:Glyco-hydro-cc domain-containing protein [Mycena chlorophos]|uniref:Glyco-hydro-cc domain-containing protein n=1 Tax=Mycena chlorophos TaxID=658473 RepID=A0A8H6TB90_MYCCL|nr:Glyco-hydro-cc domain-containing protein [Mycena chlorophos]
MAPSGLLNLASLAVISLVSLTLSSPANAVSLLSNHVARNHHDLSVARNALEAEAVVVARSNRKSKRANNASRCKATSSSAKPSSTSKKATSTTTHKATTTSTKKAVATTASTSVKTSTGIELRGKACLAWPNYDYNDLSTWKGSSVGLIYSWDAVKVPGAEELGFTYAPMLWGWKNAADFKSRTVAGYSNIALGMNEPDQPGQSNMDPGSGISLWWEYMEPLVEKGYTLISPAVSNAPAGKTWMAAFMAGCNGCHISGIAVHHYGTSESEFESYVTYWHDTYGLDVYITEYADQDFSGGPQASMDEIWTFMEAASAFVNKNSWIKAHCWFGAMEDLTNVNPDNSLMNSAGNAPNDLGYYFINN